MLRATRFPLADDIQVPDARIAAAPQLLREQQRAFATTGGLHAAGLLGPDGSLVSVREDVGRHNAVDKVIGWAIRQGRLPLPDTVLVVSGRASYELTQKAVLAGLPMLAAVSAPSSLAVELAQQAGLTLVGFVRGETMNVYAHPGRIVDAGRPPTPPDGRLADAAATGALDSLDESGAADPGRRLRPGGQRPAGFADRPVQPALQLLHAGGGPGVAAGAEVLTDAEIVRLVRIGVERLGITHGPAHRRRAAAAPEPGSSWSRCSPLWSHGPRSP